MTELPHNNLADSLAKYAPGPNDIMPDATAAANRVIGAFEADKAAAIEPLNVAIKAETARADEAETRANTDGLTGLMNKAAWKEALSSSIVTAERDGTGLAVLFIDLSGFKEVNDTHGHDKGDEMLKGTAGIIKEVSGILQETLRTEESEDDEERSLDIIGNEPNYSNDADNSGGGRLGGDEFSVLLPGITDNEQINEVKRRLMAALIEKPELIDVGMDIGSAIWRPGVSAQDLLKEADSDMYRRKKAQKAAVDFTLNRTDPAS